MHAVLHKQYYIYSIAFTVLHLQFYIYSIACTNRSVLSGNPEAPCLTFSLAEVESWSRKPTRLDELSDSASTTGSQSEHSFVKGCARSSVMRKGAESAYKARSSGFGEDCALSQDRAHILSHPFFQASQKVGQLWRGQIVQPRVNAFHLPGGSTTLTGLGPKLSRY